MDISPETIAILGPIGVLFFFAIKEFFSYLKSKNSPALTDQIFKELQTMNNNHLHSIEDAVKAGNDRIVDALNSGMNKQIEILGRIEGKLGSR